MRSAITSTGLAPRRFYPFPLQARSFIVIFERSERETGTENTVHSPVFFGVA